MNYTNNDNRNFINLYYDYINNTNISITQILRIINSQNRSLDYLIHNNNIFNNNNNNINNPINRRTTRYNSRIDIDTFFNSILNRNINNNINTNNNFQEDVVVKPTFIQLTNAIINTHFCYIENPINYYCPISQIDFSYNSEVIQLCYCKHIFSKNHILNWFENSVFCPLCRHDIREQNLENNETDRDEMDRDETDRDETDRDETDRDETDRDETDRDETDRDETDRDRDRDGMDRDETDRDGMDRDETDRDGMDRDETDRDGMDRNNNLNVRYYSNLYNLINNVINNNSNLDLSNNFTVELTFEPFNYNI